MTDDTHYPRVLVVAVNPINAVQSNGLLMRSLFQGWPKDRLAQIYFPFFHQLSPDGSVCRNYLRVNPLGIGLEEHFDQTEESQQKQESRGRAAMRRIARTPAIRAGIVEPLREIMATSPWLDRKVLRFSRKFQPDVVYTLLGTLGVTRVSALVANELDCPVVPHFTDHWIDTKFVGPPHGTYLRHRLLTWLERVLGRSPIVLTVSQSMAEAYRVRLGKECLALANLVEPEPYDLADEPPGTAPSPLRLCYAGNLGLKRWSVLKTVGAVLRNLQQTGLDARLEIYCSAEDRHLYGRELNEPGVVKVQEWVSPSRLPELLQQADVLVHVESHAPQILNYTRFSLSTKIAYYMMAGRCLLLVGPSDAGSMQEVRKMDAGVVVSPHPQEQLEQTIRQILSDRKLRERMGRKAREQALQHFEATSQRETFRKTLARVMHERPSRKRRACARSGDPDR